jgi:hypothetical protein
LKIEKNGDDSYETISEKSEKDEANDGVRIEELITT